MRVLLSPVTKLGLIWAVSCFVVSAIANPLILIAHKQIRGHVLEVRAISTEYSSVVPFRVPGSWWGTEDSLPRTIISELSVTVDGRPTFVPLSSYADLADPREVQIQEQPSGFDVVISGSDAAGSYSAVLTFEDNALRQRLVRSGEFPDQRWEKTTYSFFVPH